MIAFRKVAILLLCPTLAAGAAGAGSMESAMPSAYYDTVGAKLMNVGYRDLRVVDADAGKVVAYDEQGSEVVLTIHPSNRQIVNSVYVHPQDH